ncbi:hypothetical protein JCM10212_004152 [Sporobolomyces blumeae]
MPATYFPPDHDRPPPVPVSPPSPLVPNRRRSSGLVVSPRDPGSPTSTLLLTSPPLPRSTSLPLESGNDDDDARDSVLFGAQGVKQRRRASAWTDLDPRAIESLSLKARQAELRARWEGRYTPHATKPSTVATATTTMPAVEPVVVDPPTTPPRRSRNPHRTLERTASAASSSASSYRNSLYETPVGGAGYSLFPVPPMTPSASNGNSPAFPPRPSPRSPRSRDPSTASLASSHSPSSHLDAVSEFLNEEEPPSSPGRLPPSVLPRRSNSIRSDRTSSTRNSCTIFPSRRSATSPYAGSIASFSSPRRTSSIREVPFDRDPLESDSIPPLSDDDDDDADEKPLSSAFAPRLVKTSEVDRFVAELDNGLERKRRAQEEERRRRERDSSEPSASTSDSDQRSRTESNDSDASFASMTALGPPLPLRDASGEEEKPAIVLDGGFPVSSSMARDETLRPTSYSAQGLGIRSSMPEGSPSLTWGARDNGKKQEAKSIEELIRGYKAIERGAGGGLEGVLARRRSSVVSSAASTSPVLTRRGSDATATFSSRGGVTRRGSDVVSPTSTIFPSLLPEEGGGVEEEEEDEEYPPRTTSPDRGPYAPAIGSTSSEPVLLPYVPFPVASAPSLSSTNWSGKIKTIEEIIAEHAASAGAFSSKPRPSSRIVSGPPAALSTKSTGEEAAPRPGLPTGEADGESRQASETSADQERKAPAETFEAGTTRPLPAASGPTQQDERRVAGGKRTSSLLSGISRSLRSPSPSQPRTESPRLDAYLSPSTPTVATSAAQELSLLLRSPRLTRLITLSRPAHEGLTVSLADVGSSTGHPVVVFLGLGSVRYLVALYDEFAEALGLRLICLDRWGIGKTTQIPDAARGFDRWSEVVAEVLEDHLGLEEYSVLAHSAGGPYALSSCLRAENLRPGPDRAIRTARIRGAVHLLSPWVAASSSGGASGASSTLLSNLDQPPTQDSLVGMYKYLKYVPSGVIKTAQTAEWKIQGWKLGKGPGGLDDVTNSLDLADPVETKGESPARVGFGARGEAAGLEGGGGARSGRRASWTPTRPGSSKRNSSISLASGSKAFLGSLFGGGGGSSGSESPSSTSALGGHTRSSSRAVSSGGAGLDPTGPTGQGKKNLSFAASPSGNRSSPPTPLSMTPARSSTLLASGLPMPATPTPGSSTRSSHAPSPRSPSPAYSLVSNQLSPPPRSDSTSSFRPSSPSSLLSPSSPVSSTTTTTAGPVSPSRSSISPDLLISGLLRASHAESLAGSTSDLLVLLDRTSRTTSSTPTTTATKAPGGRSTIDYKEIRFPIKVWYGDRDDRIGLQSIKWLERQVDACTLKLVKGADHNLMTNGPVMLEVLESIANEWSKP